MKVVAIIPARGGSKSIPKKNIKKLGDKTLIEHTIKSAKECKQVDKIYVSTDNSEIKKIATKNNVDVLDRNSNFADDFTPVIPDVANYVINQIGDEFDIIVILEPTYPFRKSKTICRVIDKVLKSNYDWVATISRIKEHPYRARLLNGDEILPFTNKENIFSQRQDLPDVYMLRGAVYGAHINKIFNNNKIENLNWGGVVIDDIEAIDIDEPIDFLIAEGVVKNENK